MLKAMRAQDKKEAQAAQAQDRVSIQDFLQKEMLSKINCNKKTINRIPLRKLMTSAKK